MLKINISQLHSSDYINAGKTLYNIEFIEPLWIFKKIESKIVIRRNKDKDKLKEFAFDYCRTHNSEICIIDNTGKTEEVINF